MVKIYVILWSINAKSELKSIYKYYAQFSKQAALRLANDLVNEVENLHYFPEKYSIDNLLENPYRALVFKNYKIIYTIKGFEIYILSIFDTRQSPEKLQKTVNRN